MIRRRLSAKGREELWKAEAAKCAAIINQFTRAIALTYIKALPDIRTAQQAYVDAFLQFARASVEVRKRIAAMKPGGGA